MPRHAAALLLACCAALPPGVLAADTQRPEVGVAAAALQERVVAWRRDIHQHPELSNRETRTAAKVADHLRGLGLQPRTGIAHHGVTAVLRGGRPGPRLALRADMDALPVTEETGLPFASTATDTYRGQRTGVMHACGHDAHTAILMGVAEALVGMREQLAGEVLFVFQPAEEGAPEGEQGGARLMLEEGVFADFRPDAVFGLHVFSTLNADTIGVRAGPTMAASDRFGIRVIGRQTHGSRPWGGVDPIIAAAQIVNQSQAIVSRQMDISAQPVVLSFGAINGGIRYNIIPDAVELVGTIRTFDEDMRADVFRRLGAVAEHVAAANGATVEARIPAEEGNPVTFNNEALTARMRPSLEAAAGTGKVVDMPLVMGAEDFSLYAREVPGLFFFVGATPVGVDAATAPSNHSPKFDVDESALDLGLRAMLQATLDYLDGDAGS
ncbi:N-acyl-L-amino acid amidohydrolase [Lysobacteraceae bacterium NML91-0213]|nr:N-acyl-L-amino acid amidohydrolase [Xanthomonadaceae bacterium NML91-0213]